MLAAREYKSTSARQSSSSASCSSRSRSSRQRFSNMSCEPISSSTSIRGGSPASMGNSDRMRCANECRVPRAARSSSSMAAAHDRASRSLPTEARVSSSRTRCRSSLAAFSVKVIAAMSVMAMPDLTVATMRSTSAVVFPEPAPASTKRVSSSEVRMQVRAG